MWHVIQVMAQLPLLRVAPVALLVPSGLVEGVKARFFSYGNPQAADEVHRCSL